MAIAIQKTNTPKEMPKSDKLGFGQFFSDHLFETKFNLKQEWHTPQIVPYHQFSLDPAASVLHYGQALFEGMKAFYGTDGKIRLFRPEKNYERMQSGAARLCMQVPSYEMFIEGIKQLIRVDRHWVPKTRGTSLYIRPTLIGTGAFLGVRPADEFLFYVITSPVGAYYAQDHETVSIWIENRYSRAARGGVGATKSGGNYAASLLAAQKAKERGFSQVLWLDSAHKKNIEEVGTMNVFFVIDNQLITPPLGGSILPGVTRDSIILLAKRLGYSVQERNIDLDELSNAYKQGRLQEAFGTGTAATISPIGKFGLENSEIIINDQKAGPVARHLLTSLSDIYYGDTSDHWSVLVD